MFDWTKVSANPGNVEACRQVSGFLRSITRTFDGNKPAFVKASCTGKRMMDVGAGEHDISYHNEEWEHAIYKAAASNIVAIEIDPILCDYYNEKGFDFRCVDATSEIDLEDRFDFVYCGDVIEHVDNPVALMRFIGRHMEIDARCVVTTPNPAFTGFRSIAKAKSDLFFISNLQHISWVVPTHMLEILRRANIGLEFEHILVPESANNNLMHLGGKLEEYFGEFIYVLKKVE